MKDEELQFKIVSIESQITVINEELGMARGLNRKNLVIHYADKLLDLFTELQSYRRLTFKEKMAFKFLNTYGNKTSRSNTRKLKKARDKVEKLTKSGKLKGVELDTDFE